MLEQTGIRNPDEDLPIDFEQRREENYKALKQPLDSEEFISNIKNSMDEALSNLTSDMPKNLKVSLSNKKEWMDYIIAI